MKQRLQMPANQRLIVALDLPDQAQARELVDTLTPDVVFFKVGLELFLAAGFPMLEYLLSQGCQVMLDLKFYDVPNTVAAAVRQVAARGAALATLHGDPAIMRAAAQHGGDCGLLAVTALTSLSEQDLQAMGYHGSVEQLVLDRARMAQEAGLTGVVCSPREAALLRRELGWGLRIVTPGVRPASHAPGDDDQKRVATPGKAIADGADHIVMGRPIRQADAPRAMAREVLAEIVSALNHS